MLPILDKPVLNPGIMVQPRLARRTINCLVDPLYFLRRFDLQEFLNAVIRVEASWHPAGTENVLRETLASYPGVPFVGRRGIIETNVTQSPPGNIKSGTRDDIRERSRESIPLTFIIWITGFFIAFDPTSREEYKQKTVNSYIPKFHLELLKRTRTGILGNFRVELSVLRGTSRRLIRSYPDLRNTFVDIDWLLTPTGISALVRFFNVLGQSAANYVPMLLCTPTTIPPMESSYTITYTALTIEVSQKLLIRGSVYMLMGSSYGQRVPSTHLADAFFTRQIIAEVGGSKNLVRSNDSLTDTAGVYEISGSVQGWAGYIVARVTGIEPNPDWYMPEQNASESAPVVTKPQRGERRRQRSDERTSQINGDTLLAEFQTPEQFSNILKTAIKMLHQNLFSKPKFGKQQHALLVVNLAHC